MYVEDCWMTFTEALAAYLEAQKAVDHFMLGTHAYNCALEDKKIASEHMEAWVLGTTRDKGE